MNKLERTRKPSSRLGALRPSATVEMTEHVRLARISGRKLIGLSSGDPQLKTDDRIVAAAVRAIERGETHYGPPAGVADLRAAIVAREAARSGAAYDAADILVTPGGKFALFAGLMGVVEPGDEVIIPEPGWVSYSACVALCEGVPIALPMLDRIDLQAVERAITPRSKAIIINSPANPTGRIITARELAGLITLAHQRGLWIVFDQVYADLTYGSPMVFPQGLADGQECSIVVDSLSKTFGMTGWRLGYLAAPSILTKPILKFLQHSTYCVPPFIQSAGVEALRLHDELVLQYRGLFHRRLVHMAKELSGMDGIRCPMPDGTFYLFPEIAGDDVATARHWLDSSDIAVMPGSAFGKAGTGHLRLSVTCSDAELDEALARIRRTGIVRASQNG
jgi:aspartate aminotransferase